MSEIKRYDNYTTNNFGCPRCAIINTSIQNRLSQEEFIARAQEALGDTYDLSKTVYKGYNEDVEVYDKLLGEYFSKKAKYILLGLGNTNRGLTVSKGEEEIKKSLDSLGIPYKAQYLIDNDEIKLELMSEGSYKTKVILDFYIEYNGNTYVIEYNGSQHYKFTPYFHRDPSDFFNQIRRDQALEVYCSMVKNYTYIVIPDDVDLSTIKDALDAIINKGEYSGKYFPEKLPSFEEVQKYEDEHNKEVEEAPDENITDNNYGQE